jgi:hypothetical protein
VQRPHALTEQIAFLNCHRTVIIDVSTDKKHFLASSSPFHMPPLSTSGPQRAPLARSLGQRDQQSLST